MLSVTLLEKQKVNQVCCAGKCVKAEFSNRTLSSCQHFIIGNLDTHQVTKYSTNVCFFRVLRIITAVARLCVSRKEWLKKYCAGFFLVSKYFFLIFKGMIFQMGLTSRYE